MTAERVLQAARKAAERLMVDACVINRVTGSTTDKATGVKTPTTVDVYSGPCRVQQRAQQGRQVDVGQDPVTLLRFELHLPVATSVGMRDGDVATITVSAWDPDLVGRKFRIRDLAHATAKTARRVGVEEVT